MAKIVILDGYVLNPGDLDWSGFEALGRTTVYDRTREEDVIARIADNDCVVTNKTVLTRDIIRACPGIRFIGVLATGYNVVDIGCAREMGIPVANVPAYGTASVAQHTVAMLLEICNHVALHADAVAKGRWTNSPDFCFWDAPLIELDGKTMGVVGFGRIGRAVGRIAKAMGMRVIAYNPSQCDEGRAIGEYVPLEKIWRQSDVISLNCPLNDSTQRIVNAGTIARMRNGAILINTGRGPLIDEQALSDALNRGKLYAAGVDVASMEPIRADNPLLTAKNCFITPHISWASLESRKRLMRIAVDNLAAYLAGLPVNVVNP